MSGTRWLRTCSFQRSRGPAVSSPLTGFVRELGQDRSAQADTCKSLASTATTGSAITVLGSQIAPQEKPHKLMGSSVPSLQRQAVSGPLLNGLPAPLQASHQDPATLATGRLPTSACASAMLSLCSGASGLLHIRRSAPCHAPHLAHQPMTTMIGPSAAKADTQQVGTGDSLHAHLVLASAAWNQDAGGLGSCSACVEIRRPRAPPRHLSCSEGLQS